MRSKAHLKGHPLHPALIPFPFAFLTGALLFDAAGWAIGNPALVATGGHLAAVGIVAALIAAIPGAVDYFFTVPPKSSGGRRATKHALANLAAVALFATAWAARPAAPAGPGALALLLETAGAGALLYGGWLGGTLVTRNLISVDHRYAGAGKWTELAVEAGKDEAVTVARTDELDVNQMKLLRINGRRIVLGRTEEGYVAFDDHCTHRGGSLAGGVLICGTVQYLWHGSQFDVDTGKVTCGPAKKDIRTYQVTTAGGTIRLRRAAL